MTSGDWHPRRKVDPARVAELYESGLSVSGVARELRIDRKTVYNNLARASVTLRGDKPKGRERQTTCAQGHAFDDENTRIRKLKNGTEKRCCIKCERRRWREKEQRKRDRRAEIDAIIFEFIQEQTDNPTS